MHAFRKWIVHNPCEDYLYPYADVGPNSVAPSSDRYGFHMFVLTIEADELHILLSYGQ